LQKGGNGFLQKGGDKILVVLEASWRVDYTCGAGNHLMGVWGNPEDELIEPRSSSSIFVALAMVYASDLRLKARII
jgi:hypothetical protein